MNPIDLLILLEKRIKITATTTPINLLPTKWTLAEIRETFFSQVLDAMEYTCCKES